MRIVMEQRVVDIKVYVVLNIPEIHPISGRLGIDIAEGDVIKDHVVLVKC